MKREIANFKGLEQSELNDELNRNRLQHNVLNKIDEITCADYSSVERIKAIHHILHQYKIKLGQLDTTPFSVHLV